MSRPYGLDSKWPPFQAPDLEKRTVLWIFTEIAKGRDCQVAGGRGRAYTLRAIANELNKRGVPAPRSSWWPATIAYIVNNDRYRSLVPFILFNKARLALRCRDKRRATRRDHNREHIERQLLCAEET